MTIANREFPLELRPTDIGDNATDYQVVYNRWVDMGRPGMVENLSGAWMYRVVRPDPAQTDPTFLLAAFSVFLTDADNEGAPGGYVGGMSTGQSTLPGGQRALPRE